MANDRLEFGKVIATMAKIYDKEMTEPMVALYWAALQKYPIDRLQEAAAYIISTRKYTKMPLPADFIEYIDPPEDLETKGVLAANEALDKMEFEGSGKSVQFGDPIISQVIDRLGGWITVCHRVQLLEGEVDFWIRDFSKMYAYLSQHGNRKEIKLVGRYESDNRAAGFLDDSGMLRLPDGSEMPAPLDEGGKDIRTRIEEKNVKQIAS